MNQLKILLAALVISMISWSARSQSEPSTSKLCDDQTISSSVCKKMRFLRSQVMLLGEQRDLMQVNYSLLERIGLSMEQVTTQLMTSNEYSSHLQGIERVKASAAELSHLAASRSSDAFAAANGIRNHCTSCHQDPMPGQTLAWHDLARMNWETITRRCNEVGRNPHLCKNMYGMVSSIAYFQAANGVVSLDYSLAYQAAQELARVAGYIQTLRTHGDTDVLSKVQDQAQEIMSLAQSKDPHYLEKGLQLTSSCFTCHK